MDDFDADKTFPDTRTARARHITSQTAIDAVQLLLGRLDSVVEDDRASIVNDALQQAFDRGQAAARLERAELDVLLAQTKQQRDTARRVLRDAEAALLQYEREEDPESYTRLRNLLRDGGLAAQ